MATRILLFAARNTSPAEVQAAFPRLAPARTSGDWTWCVSSLWKVRPSELDTTALEGPLLLVTTSDDAQWTLRLRGGDRAPFGMTSHHALLGRQRGESKRRFRDELIERFAKGPADCWPPSTVRELSTSSLADARLPFLRMQAAALVEALERFEIPHDRRAVVDCLTGATRPDADCPIGNLGQLAACFGLDLQANADDADQDPGNTCTAQGPEEPGARGGPTGEPPETGAEPSEPQPLAQGPVVLPLSQLADLRFLTWCCEPSGRARVALRLPASTASEGWTLSLNPSRFAVHATEGGVIDVEVKHRQFVTFEERAWFKSLGRALESAPPQTMMELTVRRSGAEERQVHRGKLAGGALHVTHALPAVPAPILEEALTLMAEANDRKRSSLRARSTEEAGIVAEAARRDWHVAVQVDGLELSCEKGKDRLAQALFKARFREHWDEQDAQLRVLRASRDERRRAELCPAEAADDMPGVVHRGECALYRRAQRIDLACVVGMSRAECRFRTELLGEDPLGEDRERKSDLDPGSLESVRSRLEECGYEHVGDVVGERSRAADFVLRAFCHRDRTDYAVHQDGAVQLYTPLSGAASLTTTTQSWPVDLPHAGLFRKGCQARTVRGLRRIHAKRLGELQAEGRSALLVEPSLEDFTRALDASLVRQFSS